MSLAGSRSFIAFIDHRLGALWTESAEDIRLALIIFHHLETSISFHVYLSSLVVPLDLQMCKESGTLGESP